MRGRPGQRSGRPGQRSERRSRVIAAGLAVICLVAVAGFGAWRLLFDADRQSQAQAPKPAKPPKLAKPPGPPKGLTAPAQTFDDLAYANRSPAQKLDLYLPARAGIAIPLVIVIHGGAFAIGDKHDEPGIISALTAAGYAAASINYRLAGEAPFPAAVQDAKASVRWLRANAAKYGLDPDQFAAWGTSAGGNIAAMVGVTGSSQGFLDDVQLGNADRSSALSAVVDWYGPSDFLTMDAQAKNPGGCPGQPQRHDPPNSPESTYVGAPIQSVPDRVRAASPISYLAGHRKQPVFFLAAGSADCNVPHAQSQEFAAALKKARVPVTLTIVAGAGHADPAIAATQTGPAIAFLRTTFGR